MTNTSNPSNCPKCGNAFSSESVTFTVFGATVEFKQNFCDNCISEFERKKREAQYCASEKPTWESIAPKLYANLNIERLPKEARAIYNDVMKWEAGSEKGIGLKGVTETGKSFLIHRLFKRLYEDDNQSVCMTTGTEFAFACGSPDGNERRDIIKRIIDADCALIDDFGKEKITARVESDLFHIIESRRRSMKPLFVTLNFNAKRLTEEMKSENQEPIIRRLKEACDFFTMGKV